MNFSFSFSVVFKKSGHTHTHTQTNKQVRAENSSHTLNKGPTSTSWEHTRLGLINSLKGSYLKKGPSVNLFGNSQIVN